MNLVENNEIAYGGDQQKSINSGPTIWRGNWFHHNDGVGLWNDGEGNASIIEDNVVDDNGGPGIHLELAVAIEVRRNTMRRNADQGLYLSTARDVLVENNLFEDNWRGIVIFINCFSTTQGWTWQPDLANNTIRNNTIKVGTTPAASFASLFSWGDCTTEQLAPYHTNAKNNWFVDNQYYVPDVNGWWWLWAPNTFPFAGWQSLGQDTTGSVFPR